MSDPVLASIIAAAATLVATIMQLRASFAKDATTRASQGSSRRKSRAPMALLFVVLIAAASGGFALSHWLTADERIAKVELQQDLKARIADLDRTAAQLAQARSGVRAELEAETLKQIGEAGVISLAALAPCRPATQIAPSTDSTATAACTESEATTVALCASVPAHATVSDVELYTRPVDSDTPWSAARVQAGQEVDHARFAPSTSEIADSESTKLVCQGFSHWASDHARAARMVVHYRL